MPLRGAHLTAPNFHGSRPLHEKRENYAPRKFSAIRYVYFPGMTVSTEAYVTTAQGDASVVTQATMVADVSVYQAVLQA